MKWTGVTAYDERKTVLEVGGAAVARLSERTDGNWFVYLWYHRPEGQWVQRGCSSFEQGRAGVETWARRHMDTLLAEAAAIQATWWVLPTPDPNRTIEHRPLFPNGDPPHPGRPRGRRRGRKAF